MANLISLCNRHHWLVHEGGWTITGPQGGWRFHSPDGKVLGLAPTPSGPVAPLPHDDRIAPDAVASVLGPERFSLSDAVSILGYQDHLYEARRTAVDAANVVANRNQAARSSVERFFLRKRAERGSWI